MGALAPLSALVLLFFAWGLERRAQSAKEKLETLNLYLHVAAKHMCRKCLKRVATELDG